MASEKDSERQARDSKRTASNEGTADADDGYLHGVKFILVLLGLFLAIFCMALDNTIIATAIPRITDQFKSINDVGWYGSAYLLTTCAFQLSYGKLYTFYSVKWTYIFALTIFEIGSLICGVAPNSMTLIIGRAVAGIGGAGLFSGCIIIISHVAPPPKRPMYIGLVGGMFGIACVIGPLLGGVFTDKLSWRWCFYINLPLGAVTAVFLVLCFGETRKSANSDMSRKQRLKQFDFCGSVCILGSVICLLLALQWGGSKFRWSAWQTIILLVSFAVLGVAFIGVQIWRKDMATVPPRIFRKRVIWASAWFAFTSAGSFFVLVYFIPIWFQAIKKASPVRSGIMNLPLILGQVVMLVVTGRVVSKYGQFAVYMVVSTVLATVGSGLITTFTAKTGTGEWVSYQLITGMGRGIGFQMPLIAAQASLARDEIPVGTAVIAFFQSFGGAIFVSVAQNVFTTRLLSYLRHNEPQVDADSVLNAGPTELEKVIPSQFLPQVQIGYNKAIQAAFYVGVAVSAVSIIGVAFTEWKNLAGQKGEVENTGTPSQGEKTSNAA